MISDGYRDSYFENTDRFVQEDYTPTEEDQVMARVMTTGIVTNEISSAPITLTVVDVGGVALFSDCMLGRLTYKKWYSNGMKGENGSIALIM